MDKELTECSDMEIVELVKDKRFTKITRQYTVWFVRHVYSQHPELLSMRATYEGRHTASILHKYSFQVPVPDGGPHQKIYLQNHSIRSLYKNHHLPKTKELHHEYVSRLVQSRKHKDLSMVQAFHGFRRMLSLMDSYFSITSSLWDASSYRWMCSIMSLPACSPSTMI